MEFTNISSTKLYHLCNKYQWFTTGDNRQYSLLFKLADEGAPLEKLATIIWICSSNAEEKDILKILKQEADNNGYFKP